MHKRGELAKPYNMTFKFLENVFVLRVSMEIFSNKKAAFWL